MIFDLSSFNPSHLAAQDWFLSAVWWLLLALLLLPIILFLLRGWVHRRDDIVSSISPDAARRYLLNFRATTEQEKLGLDNPGRAMAEFVKFYSDRFGRARFFWPALITLVLAGFLLAYPLDLAKSSQEGKPPGTFLWVVGFAILGGYTRVVYELCTRYYQDNIRPSDLLWGCYRLIISVPLGYTVGVMLDGGANARVASPAAFLLGLFPTSTVTTWGRRLFSKWTGTEEMDTDHPQQLKVLPALDTFTTELITEEGITTITQLAYVDPIRLSIRTGLNFSFVVTCVSEAVLATQLLTLEDMKKARRFGVWGAYEAFGLWKRYISGDPESHLRADHIITALAADLGWTRDGLENVLAQIHNDPYVKFIRECWASNMPDDEPDVVAALPPLAVAPPPPVAADAAAPAP